MVHHAYGLSAFVESTSLSPASSVISTSLFSSISAIGSGIGAFLLGESGDVFNGGLQSIKYDKTSIFRSGGACSGHR